MIFFIASFSACPSSTFQVTFLFLNCRLPLFALLAFSSASLAFSLKRIIPYTKRKKNECSTLQFVVRQISFLKAISQTQHIYSCYFQCVLLNIRKKCFKSKLQSPTPSLYAPFLHPKQSFFSLVHRAFSWHVPPINLVVTSAHYPSDMEKKIPHLVKRLKDKSKWLSRNYFN